MQKSILITGCSSGIGYAAAHILREAGWRVFASCRQPQDCERLRREGFEAPHLDYTDEVTIHAAVAEVLKATGGTLDAVFQNAAIAIPGAMEDVPTAALREIFEVNLFGWHTLNRAVIPIMRDQGHGRIVFCSSVLGMVAAPWRGAYVATKFALKGMVDTLRIEMRDTPLHFVLIEPGPITSLFRKNSARNFERWVRWQDGPRAEQYENELLTRLYKDDGPDRFELPPEAVARKLIRALEHPNPNPRYFVTTPTYIAAGLNRLLPTRLLDAILARF